MAEELKKGLEKKKIIIIGAGFGGLRFLYDIKRHFRNEMDITIVDERETSLEKPSLVEVALAGKPVSHTQIPIKNIAKSQNVEFINSGAYRIEPKNNLVTLKNGSRINYDYLVIAAGAVKDYAAIPGFREYGYSVCDDYQAPRMWEAIQNFKGGNIVIGAAKTRWDEKSTDIKLDAPCEGPIGEIMFMLDFYLREHDLREISTITVFTPGNIFFDDVGPKIHKKIEPLIVKKDIKVVYEKVISRIEMKSVHFEDGTELPSDLTLVIPPYTGPDVIKESGIGDQYGFIRTDKSMRHPVYKNIFVVGDCNANSMPKLGHIATIQADVAASSFIKEITGEGEVMEFKPEVFCIMNRGGSEATLILSDTLFGGKVDITLNGPLAHIMKWGFDVYSYYTRGKLPPEFIQNSLEKMLKEFK
jgi:sulfide:quinone oxidoreductase